MAICSSCCDICRNGSELCLIKFLVTLIPLLGCCFSTLVALFREELRRMCGLGPSQSREQIREQLIQELNKRLIQNKSTHADVKYCKLDKMDPNVNYPQYQEAYGPDGSLVSPTSSSSKEQLHDQASIISEQPYRKMERKRINVHRHAIPNNREPMSIAYGKPFESSNIEPEEGYETEDHYESNSLLRQASAQMDEYRSGNCDKLEASNSDQHSKYQATSGKREEWI